MEMKSVFNNVEKIPIKYTADGDNLNPPLEIFNIPNGTKSLVIIVDDPDAERVVGYTWIHWIRFNIPVFEDYFNPRKNLHVITRDFSGNPKTNTNLKSFVMIEENSQPGIGGFSTYKREEYGGPNPPKGSGIHRYFFKVYAIDSKLNLNREANKIELEKAMDGHVIDEAELVGIYGRD
jgi:Raf kinase inhibitor-like YbhB/YbcL family protein